MLAHEDTGRELTFAEYRRRLPAGRGRPVRRLRGDAPGTGVSWELPTWNESLVLVGALARLGARQNPLIPIYRAPRGRVHHRPERRLPADRAHRLPRLRLRGHGPRDRRRPARAGGAGGRPRPARRRPGRPARGRAAAGLRGRRPVRWLFYTSGTTADPKGAPHTDLTVMASALAMSECLDIRADDVSALVFPFTHIGGIGWLHRLPVDRVPPAHHRGVRPGGHPGLPGRQPRDPGRLGDHLPPGLPGRPAGGRADDPLFPRVRSYPGGGAPKPPQLHYDLKREIGGVGIVSGYGLTEAPIVVMATHRRPRREAGRHRGPAHPGGGAHRGGPRRQPGRARRGGGDPPEGPPGHPRLPRPLPRRRGLRRRGLLPQR